MMWPLVANVLAVVAGYFMARALERKRCKHQYVEYARTYVAPANWSDCVTLSDTMRVRSLAGYTTIFFRCTLCPSAHCAELPGQHFGNGTVTKLRSVQ